MTYRHEWKHEISLSDMITLRHRLQAVAQADEHTTGGTYKIRSLYFDDPSDRVLREKLDGISRREKFRIRYYNDDTSLIHLEKKSKFGSLSAKESALITAGEAQAILDNDLPWMADSREPLVRELYYKMTVRQLRPKTIVDYIREPYIFPAGNVRVTIDHDIRTGLLCTDLLDPECVTVPAAGPTIILEVKWDDYLPDIIRSAVQLDGIRASAFSKYAACRRYG